MKKVYIKGITISINGEVSEVPVDEARELYMALNGLFSKESVIDRQVQMQKELQEKAFVPLRDFIKPHPVSNAPKEEEYRNGKPNIPVHTSGYAYAESIHYSPEFMGRLKEQAELVKQKYAEAQNKVARDALGKFTRKS